METTDWTIPAETTEKLSNGISDLRAELEGLRDQYDEKCSEKPSWADTKKATNVEVWLSNWEDFIDSYDALDAKPEK